MLEFKCNHCGASIAVEEGERSRPVVCLSCNTRQRVSENAVQIPDVAVLVKAAAKERVAVAPKPPAYDLVYIGAVIVMTVGILECVGSLLAAAMEASLIPLLGVAGGLVLIAFGAVMLCIRDIAINTWHLRQQGR